MGFPQTDVSETRQRSAEGEGEEIGNQIKQEIADWAGAKETGDPNVIAGESLLRSWAVMWAW